MTPACSPCVPPSLLGQADLVVGSAELTGRVAHLLPEAAAVIETGQGGADARALISAVQAGQIVVRLCPGDPLLFGQAAAEADACAQGRDAAGDRAGHTRRHGRSRLRWPAADQRRHRRTCGSCTHPS